MPPRDLGYHLDWCHKMASSRNFHDLDRDDVFSLAMESAWQALDCRTHRRLLALRNTIFRRGIVDLRRYHWAQKRALSRCRSSFQNDEDDAEDLPDRSLHSPLDVLCARETLAPLIQFYEAHGYPPAAPCTDCGTLGGLIRHDGTAPRRTDGLCHRCYQLTRRSRARAGHC